MQCARSCVGRRLCHSLPSLTETVICGGGIIGTSVAYHLTESGHHDVVLLEQGSVGCGTTWHAAGLVCRVKPYPELTFIQYGKELYKKLEEDGYSTGWKENGSLMIARSSDRLLAFHRSMQLARAAGIEVHEIVNKDDIGKVNPLVNLEGIKGCLYVPGDGIANPTDICNTFAKVARKNGAEIHEECTVEKVVVENGKVAGVDTNKGPIRCKNFVNTCGMWSRHVGGLSEPAVSLPLHPVEHFYVVTKPLDGVDIKNLPPTREYDGAYYYREWSGGLLLGTFERNAKPAFRNESIPENFRFQLLPEDWQHFGEPSTAFVYQLCTPSQENFYSCYTGDITA